jgi:iron complex transport system substrate-binding protein
MSSIMPSLRGFPAFAAICAVSLALFTSVAFGQDTGIESVVEGADARTVVHSAGTAKVPLNPSRVVPLTATLLDMVVSLGITPAASVTVDEGGFPPYLDEELAGVPAVGDDERPLHEAIIATNPDVIIADPFEAHYDQVNRIAPTVVLNIWLDWKRAFVDMGRILGREQVARERLAAYTQEVETQRRLIAEMLQNQSVAVVRLTYDGRTVGLEGNIGFTENIFVDLALNPAPLVREAAWDKPGFQSISLERVPDLGADHIFLVVPDFEAATAAARQLQNNRLWERVPAVRKGNVYPVPYRTWTCKGITCNTLANRQAFELLTGRSWGDVEQ